MYTNYGHDQIRSLSIQNTKAPGFKRSFSQFLKIGDAFAIFSLSGKIPVLNDRLKIHIKGASFLDEGDVYIITSSFIRFQQKNVFLNSSSVIVF